MNGKTCGNRGSRRAWAPAVAAATALLVTACGAVHINFGSAASSAPPTPPAIRQDLAFAQCMRAHGQPNFPDPGPSWTASLSGLSTSSPGSPAARANAACEHLLPSGGT
jgi:hypothetical protein